MKPISSILLLLILLFVMQAGLQAQSVSYGYDAAGNRIARVINLTPLLAAPETDEEQPIVELKEVVADFKISIFPNPTRGRLVVRIAPLPEKFDGEISLWDIHGKIIIRRTVESGEMFFDLSAEPAGNYLMKIRLNDKESVWKIIKNN